MDYENVYESRLFMCLLMFGRYDRFDPVQHEQSELDMW